LNFHSVTNIGTIISSGILEILVQTRLQTITVSSGDLKGEHCNVVTEATPVLAELQFHITNITPTKLCKKHDELQFCSAVINFKEFDNNNFGAEYA